MNATAKVERKTIWVCQACGRTSETEAGMKDMSCRTWATLVFADSLQYSDGVLIKAESAASGVR